MLFISIESLIWGFPLNQRVAKQCHKSKWPVKTVSLDFGILNSLL